MNKDQLPLKDQSNIYFLIYLIVIGLYFVSKVFAGVGVVVLLVILLWGGIDIQDARLFAIGILLFLPLQYLKKYMEK